MKYRLATLLGIISVCAFLFVSIQAYSSSQQAAIASTQTATGFTFKQSTLTIEEGNVVKVTIIAPQTLTQTTRVPIRVLSGTAKSGSDFRTPTTSSITFYKGGLKEKTISILTIKDSKAEQPETFTVRLGTSGPLATVSIQEGGSGLPVVQNPPVTCPSPYVYGYNKPVTLISRPFSYIPWEPATPFGGGVSFPGLINQGYGSQRPANDLAVVKLGTVEAYEFTMLPETWDGQPHTKNLYQTKVPAPGSALGYDVVYGQSGGKLTDGRMQPVFAPTSSPTPGSSLNPGAHPACFQARLVMSIDECPGVIDPSRDVKIDKDIYGNERKRNCTTDAGQDVGRIDWRAAGDKYLIKRVLGTQSSFGVEGNEESCALVPGKKYYMNISQTLESDGQYHEYTPKPDEAVSCGLRVVPRMNLIQ